MGIAGVSETPVLVHLDPWVRLRRDDGADGGGRTDPKGPCSQMGAVGLGLRDTAERREWFCGILC